MRAMALDSAKGSLERIVPADQFGFVDGRMANVGVGCTFVRNCAETGIIRFCLRIAQWVFESNRIISHALGYGAHVSRHRRVGHKDDQQFLICTRHIVQPKQCTASAAAQSGGDSIAPRRRAGRAGAGGVSTEISCWRDAVFQVMHFQKSPFYNLRSCTDLKSLFLVYIRLTSVHDLLEVRNDNWGALMEEITPTHKAYWQLAKAFRLDGYEFALRKPDNTFASNDRDKTECLAFSIERQ
ncbi:hypothetical protein EVAR_5697_1 [Eumeta japonica]|uniref:Uncharacterized protein n=1 Tax=Eumeta variegata TaxID=151549 RepID=A0A4C1TAD8_EUMVA|nr:hypothetical protein EVAR_5697_1 [Eumeta japonica]